MDSAKFAQRARKILSDHLDERGRVVEFFAVGDVSYEPDNCFLHNGRVGRIGSGETAVDRDAKAEMRSALMALASLEDRQDEPLKLTAKEVIYLDLLCEGSGDAQAAEHLRVSLRAIKARKRNLCRKTNSATINQVIARYVGSAKGRNGGRWPARRRTA